MLLWYNWTTHNPAKVEFQVRVLIRAPIFVDLTILPVIIAAMSILISDKMYVGYQLRTDHRDIETPTKLGFATYLPIDDSGKQETAYNKRVSTIDSWAQGYRNKSPQAAEILDNDLLEGFKIAREVRRFGWGSGNVLWRIEDPRGFELEISSANMASVMACTTMIEGVIQGKCKWGWNTVGGSKVVLLPEASEPYQEAIENTRVKQQKTIPIKDVPIGSGVNLKNGVEGVYCGSLHYIKFDYIDERIGGYYWKPSTKKTHFFIRDDGSIYVMATPQVAEITKIVKGMMSPAWGANQINNRLRHQSEINSASGTAHQACVSEKPIKEHKIVLMPSKADAADVKYSYRQSPPVIVQEPSGQLSRVGHQYRNTQKVGITRLDGIALADNMYKELPRNEGSSRYNRSDTADLEVGEIRTYPVFDLMLEVNGELYPPRIY